MAKFPTGNDMDQLNLLTAAIKKERVVGATLGCARQDGRLPVDQRHGVLNAQG